MRILAEPSYEHGVVSSWSDPSFPTLLRWELVPQGSFAFDLEVQRVPDTGVRVLSDGGHVRIRNADSTDPSDWHVYSIEGYDEPLGAPLKKGCWYDIEWVTPPSFLVNQQ
jgi:hypothetical protein